MSARGCRLRWALAVTALCATACDVPPPAPPPSRRAEACAELTKGAWHPMSSAGAPVQAPGARLAAFWTGTEAIVVAYGGDGPLSAAAFDPCGDRWRAISPAGAPAPASSVAWMGGRLLTWSQEIEPKGFAYAPERERWEPLAWSIEAARAAAVGGVPIAWGRVERGVDYGHGTVFAASGKARPARSAHAPSPRTFAAATVAGAGYFVFGGWDQADERALPDGALFDVRHGWHALPAAGAPSPRWAALAESDGKEVIVWGGRTAAGELADGARYDLEKRRWRPMRGGGPTVENGVHALDAAHFVAIGGTRGGVYNRRRDAWEPLEAPVEMTAPWTEACALDGGAMLFYQRDGAWLQRLDPRRRSWSAIAPAGEPRSAPAILCTGSVWMVWGGTRTRAAEATCEAGHEGCEPVAPEAVPVAGGFMMRL